MNHVKILYKIEISQICILLILILINLTSWKRTYITLIVDYRL